MTVGQLETLLSRLNPNEQVGIQILTSDRKNEAVLFVGEWADYPKIRDVAFPETATPEALTYTSILDRVIVVQRDVTYKEVKP